MSFLTIFTAPKPFENPHIAIIQRNAIKSWIQLGEEVEVLLVGEENGVEAVAFDFNIRMIPSVRRNASGTPLVSSIFEAARQASTSPILVYVNADILLTSDLLQAAHQLSKLVEASYPDKSFLMIGQRWDLDIDRPLDFTDEWEKELRADVRARGKLHPPAGSDYFVFPRSAFMQIPDFAIGRAGWDNWMIFYARQQGALVVDATPSVLIVHQSHDYSHLPGGQPHYNLDESQQNMTVAGGMAHMYMVLDADKQLVNGELRSPPLSVIRIMRRMERYLMPESGEFSGVRGFLARRFRRMRRRLEDRL